MLAWATRADTAFSALPFAAAKALWSTEPMKAKAWPLSTALTNSVPAVAEAQVAGAGLAGYFHAVISADTVRHLKPAPQPYQEVARASGVAIDQVRLVAAHSWDVSGALSAGCRAAFVARPGMVLSPLGEQPDIIGPDLAAVTEQIIAVDA